MEESLMMYVFLGIAVTCVCVNLYMYCVYDRPVREAGFENM